MTEPILFQAATYYFPNLLPAGGGYTVKIWDDLYRYDMIIYEIYKPQIRAPFTICINDWKDHEKLFHVLTGMDEFTRHQHFCGRLWHELMVTPYRPAEFEIDIGMADEPLYCRKPAHLVILEIMEDVTNKMCAIPQDEVGR